MFTCTIKLSGTEALCDNYWKLVLFSLLFQFLFSQRKTDDFAFLYKKGNRGRYSYGYLVQYGYISLVSLYL